MCSMIPTIHVSVMMRSETLDRNLPGTYQENMDREHQPSPFAIGNSLLITKLLLIQQQSEISCSTLVE